MNYDTVLTKRVIAKEMREAMIPESLREFLGLTCNIPYSPSDFKDAMRSLDWNLEVIIFPPSNLVKIVDLAVTKEQEVALRTHVKKIIHFAKVIALIHQFQRLIMEIGQSRYVVASPSDFLLAWDILSPSIAETGFKTKNPIKGIES